MTDMGDVRQSEVPQDRLARIAKAMTDAAETHPEASADDKFVVMMQDGLQACVHGAGYEDNSDLIAAMLTHLRAVLQASGADLMVLGAPMGGLN